MKIAVLGAGAWGTALALTLIKRHPVRLWTWQAAHADAMNAARENTEFLPGYGLPPDMTVSADMAAVTADADLAFVATPMAGLRNTVKALRPGLPFLWLCKGLEAETGLLPHQIIEQLKVEADCGALTGPSFAEEVAKGLPAAVTLASRKLSFAREMAEQLHTPRLRIYANDDLVGAEVGGAVKNVLAIATGLCDGLGLGLNARAALMTRGLTEITRFGIALGARRETFMGLAGLGDLTLTCTGDLSRNRRVGLALSSGRPVNIILRELGHVAEGVMTAREVLRRATELGVDMPITEAICAVLDGRIQAAETVERLMGRNTRIE
jgi:glycerol-3-phosphate dehydrogenase (NAD(P)+)